MKVTVSIGARFEVVLKVAEYLDSVNSLERLITFTPRFRMKNLAVRDEHLITLPWLGAINYAAGRVSWPPGPEARFWISEQFDRAVKSRLTSCDVFYGWCAASLDSMRTAKARGAVTVLGTGSTHVAFQKELVEGEYAKLGLQYVATDPRAVAKGEQEYAEADRILVNSTFSYRTFIDRGITSDRLSLVRHDCSHESAEAPSRRTPQPKKVDDVFRILAVGQVGVRKGVHYLLDAVSRLKLRNAELVLVGPVDDSFRPILERYAGHFSLVGAVSSDGVAPHYVRASVFVLPSVEDGWGQVTTEAMSWGLPVIVSANCGSADAVCDGVNGFVVPACDPEALMEKLEYLYSSPHARIMMGENNRAHTSSRTWAHYGQEIMQVFSDVLERNRLSTAATSGAV